MRSSGKLLCDAALVEIKWLNKSYYTLRFHAPEMAGQCLPGQFVNLNLANSLDPLLRRPMSVYRCSPERGWLEFLLKVVGKATKGFSTVRAGDQFGLFGPLGRSFEFENTRDAILVGGGIGIAPLVFLAEQMNGKDIRVHFVQGFSSIDELCCQEEITPFVEQLLIATDDGSHGFHGNAVRLVQNLIERKSDLAGTVVFACGPNSMFFALEKLCCEKNLKAQFSVEAQMACGFGVCVGCPMPRQDGRGYYLACIDGPVFHLGEVSFSE